MQMEADILFRETNINVLRRNRIKSALRFPKIYNIIINLLQPMTKKISS